MRQLAWLLVLGAGLMFGLMGRNVFAGGHPAALAGLSQEQPQPLTAAPAWSSGPAERPTEERRAAILRVAAAAPAPTPPATFAARDGFSNSLGMKFVPVPGTRVLMCIHETRWQDYAAFVKDNPKSGLARDWQDQTIDGLAVRERAPEHPVVRVSWNDAQAFCQWLGQKEARIYRLPTDSEWSAAAGIGRNEKRSRETTAEMLADQLPNLFPWGTAWPPPQDAGNYADLTLPEWTMRKEMKTLENYRDGYPTTAPVMSFKPNQLGVYDLGGNVWEWCQDWWNGDKKEHTTRGCSFYDSGRPFLQTARRGHHLPDTRLPNHGFRCVVALP